MLLNFIATNEEEALWVSFSDGNGTGAGALFLKKIEEEAASSRDIDSFHGTFWCSSPKMKQCPMN